MAVDFNAMRLITNFEKAIVRRMLIKADVSMRERNEINKQYEEARRNLYNLLKKDKE